MFQFSLSLSMVMAGDGDDVKDSGKDEQLETESSSEPDESRTSQVEEVLPEDIPRESEITGGRDSPEETSVTVCDAGEDLSESGSEIVDELCVSGDEDDDDGEEVEYLADGRTINYDKYFAEESENREDIADDDFCDEEQQQVVDNIVSSFREIGDAQPPADVADLPLTQSEERLLMFGWKEGVEEDGDVVDSLEKDVPKDVSDVPKVDEDETETDEVFQDSGKEGKTGTLCH